MLIFFVGAYGPLFWKNRCLYGIGDGTVGQVAGKFLSIVTLPLAVAIWSQFAMQVFAGAVITPVAGHGGYTESELVSRPVVRQPYFLLRRVFR